jgi:hypothetical protein
MSLVWRDEFASTFPDKKPVGIVDETYWFNEDVSLPQMQLARTALNADHYNPIDEKPAYLCHRSSAFSAFRLSHHSGSPLITR